MSFTALQAQPVLPGGDPLGLGGPSGGLAAEGPSGATPGGGSPPGFWRVDPFAGLDIGRATPGVPSAPYALLPSIEVQAGATDNLRNSRTDRRSDIYGRVNPRLTLQANTVEVVGALTYAPRFSFYLDNDEQNRIDQIFNGQLLFTVIPDLFFVDVRGGGDVRSVFGELAGFDENSTDRQDRVQSTNYQISPYLVQRIGGLATVRAGYTFRQSGQSGRDTFAPGQSQPFFTSQDFVSHEGFASVRSGEDWGRLAFAAQTSNTVFEGSGIYDGAHRYMHTLQLRYALTREFAALVDGGWQDERYNGTRPYVIQEPIWGAGFRYAPDADSFFILRYGQRDGFESFSLNASLPLGVRTRLFARYSEQITSPALQASDLLSTIRVDAQGNVVDAATGIPAAITLGTPLLSNQSSLSKNRRATAAISQAWLRDTFTLTLSREERDPLATATGTTAFAQDSNSAALSWSRALAPGTGLVSTARYAVTESEISGRGTNTAFQITLAHALTPTMTGSVQYFVRVGENELQSGRSTQNTILVSLRQFF